MKAQPLIALAGSPNCGKTALFNAMTGLHQKVANYPGVTVEYKEGFVRGSDQGLRIVDLPGTYSLDPKTQDEAVALSVLEGKMEAVGSPTLVVAVADATNLERGLSLVLELQRLGRRVILALNMMDLAKKRGIEVHVGALERELSIPVIPTVAVERGGTQALVNAIARFGGEDALTHSPWGSRSSAMATDWSDPSMRFREIDRILAICVKNQASRDFVSERLDRIVVHPIWGVLLLVSVLALMFEAVFAWAGPLQDLIESGFGALSALVENNLSTGIIRDLLVYGVIAGVGGVLVFLPQILLLFLFILVLEDSGYLPRAAFLMDKLMGRVGLHGRAFIPLLSSVACAIPGIMATRTIERQRDRLVTILVAPLMPCSARIPVYTLLVAAFIPNLPVWGPFHLQGLVLFGLYFAGVTSAVVIAWILKRTVLTGATPPLLIELPTYKRPSVRSILRGMWQRGWVFIRRAGTVILSMTVLIWVLASYPKAPEDATEPAINYSFAGRIGHFVEPVLRPIGFDWRVGMALIPGFAAREVMVSALATVYAVEQAGEDEAKDQELLGDRLRTGWSLATALSLLAWYIFAPQCLSTLAVTRRETASWKWPLFMLVYLTALAYLASWATYSVALWMA